MDAYRDLVRDCAMMLDAVPETVELSDLPELSTNDLAIIQRAPGADEAARTAQFLKDVQAEAEIQNERWARARDEDFYGSSSPQTERERLEVEFGVRSLFR